MTDQAHPTAPLNQLNYAPAPPRRRRIIRRAILLITLLLIAGAGWRWGRPIASRARLLYYQRKCLDYSPPADQLVFESDPDRVKALGTDPNFRVSNGCAWRNPPGEWVVTHSGTWLPLVTLNSSFWNCPIFMHEMRSPDGHRFLVVVERIAGTDGSAFFINGYDVLSFVYHPAGWNSPLIQIQKHYAFSVKDTGNPHIDTRIYAGQIDPKDPSRFTIRYETSGTTCNVEGRVTNDGSVNFKPLNPAP